MSSRSEDLSCPICQDIFRDPVLLTCSHSFCRACLQRWWNGKKTLECPCCKRKSSKSNPPRNLALKNLCDDFRASAGSEHLCSLHSEKLKIFCLDHQQPVCVVCRDSKAHNNHRFRPVDEAAQELRQELQKALRPLQDKLTLFEQQKENCHQTEKFIKVQAKETEQSIREQVQKLHLFLQKEEETRIAAVRKEEEQKSRMMKEKIQALTADIASLSGTIRATEKELRAEDLSFLLNHKTAVRRVTQRPLLDDPEPVSGALIDVVQHLGNMTFDIWNKMKQMVFYSPVILDPNNADPELVVSNDLRSVRSGESRELPKNPERTRFPCSVLGSEGFNSGSHIWAVDVGNNKDWELGVLGEDVQVNGQTQSQLWRISFSAGKFTAMSGSDSEKTLPVTTVKKIAVHLDFDKGLLVFLDIDSKTSIHTFTHTFTHTLFPYIYTESTLPLTILPTKVFVKK